MMTALAPFHGEDEDEIYDAILADEPSYPKYMPNDAVDLIRKLLVREPEERLGYHKGAEEIMDHGFFASIDWDALYRKEVAPPFRPTIGDRNNLSNFDEEFVGMAPCLTPVQSGISIFSQSASIKLLI
jgi:classical protein kinase C